MMKLEEPPMAELMTIAFSNAERAEDAVKLHIFLHHFNNSATAQLRHYFCAHPLQEWQQRQAK